MLDWVLTLRLACSVAWQSHMQRSQPTGVVLQVFFIRDGAQFADLIHAAKPSPVEQPVSRLALCGLPVVAPRKHERCESPAAHRPLSLMIVTLKYQLILLTTSAYCVHLHHYVPVVAMRAL